MMNQSSSSNDIANVLKAMVKGNMDFSGVGNLYSKVNQLDNRQSALESRLTDQYGLPNDASDSMRVHYNEENDDLSSMSSINTLRSSNLPNIIESPIKNFQQLEQGDDFSYSTGRGTTNSFIQDSQYNNVKPLEEFKFPVKEETSLTSDFIPQINVLQEQVIKKEKQPKIIEMQEISEEQQQRNKELKEAQEKQLEQLRKDKNIMYENIKSNANVLERKKLTGDDVLKTYSDVIENLNRVNDKDKNQIAKIRSKANIVMQSIGDRHFGSETKSTMLTKLTNTSTKEKIEELRKQQGTQVEMKGTPGLIPLSERTKTIAQLQSEGTQIIESTTNENAAEKKPKKEKVSKKS